MNKRERARNRINNALGQLFMDFVVVPPAESGAAPEPTPAKQVPLCTTIMRLSALCILRTFQRLSCSSNILLLKVKDYTKTATH